MPFRLVPLPRPQSVMPPDDSPIITLLTDFGIGSPYVAQMKGVILSLNPAATIVDVTHGIPPQDIAQGAWTLAEVADSFPSGSIHVAVVDPGVGSAGKSSTPRSRAGTILRPTTAFSVAWRRGRLPLE